MNKLLIRIFLSTLCLVIIEVHPLLAACGFDPGAMTIGFGMLFGLALVGGIALYVVWMLVSRFLERRRDRET